VLYCAVNGIHMVQLEPACRESVLTGMPGEFDELQWTVVPEGIFFVRADGPKSVRSFRFLTRSDAPKSVQYFDFGTKHVRQVFQVDKELNKGLSVSPDGRWILYTQEGEDNSDIMLVDHFE